MHGVLVLFLFRIGTLALGGTYGEFYSLSREQRTQIVLSWSNSMITKLRIFARAMLALASMSFYTQPLDVVYNAIGYPGPDPEMHSERFSTKTFPAYDFIKVPAGGLELTFDVVIVGSGAGGGVMAAELSAAGKSVLVIEKGHHYSQNELTLNQCDGLTNLYESCKCHFSFSFLRVHFGVHSPRKRKKIETFNFWLFPSPPDFTLRGACCVKCAFT